MGVGKDGDSPSVGLVGALSQLLSNILKSVKLGACMLRRFAEGLPREAWSRFIIPSLRFRGLTVANEPNVPLRRFSMRESVERGANGVSLSGAPGVVETPKFVQIESSVGSVKSSRVRSFSSPGGGAIG
jgi:hypothetical protein